MRQSAAAEVSATISWRGSWRGGGEATEAAVGGVRQLVEERHLGVGDQARSAAVGE